LKELLHNFVVQRAVGWCKYSTFVFLQVSFLSRVAEFTVSYYGLPRYRGKRLVGAL
jgi:hypothetical protein